MQLYTARRAVRPYRTTTAREWTDPPTNGFMKDVEEGIAGRSQFSRDSGLPLEGLVEQCLDYRLVTHSSFLS